MKFNNGEIVNKISNSDHGKAAVNCWEDFCANTTLGGYKYIISDSSIVRRLFWLLISAAFSVITAYQIIQLFFQYSDNPIKTTVSKSYLETIDFPKVTICNTMPFRVSAAKPLGAMHVALSKPYKTPYLDPLAAKEADIYKVLQLVKDTKTYYRDAAHQIKDMIIGCTWKGQPCSAANFTEVITDQGYCCAFNTESGSSLKVTHEGADHGLEVILNVAKYEQMNGPYSTFGTTITVSPINQPPLTKSATSALVGTYTTLSLMQKEINFIRGKTCGERSLTFFTEYTRDSCILEKTFEHIAKVCGCYPFHVTAENKTLPNGAAPKICDLAQQLSCAQQYIDQPVGASNDECPSACKVVVNSVTVSTAEVAWDQVQQSFDSRSDRIAQIAADLKHAYEVAVRYYPKHSLPTQLLLDTLLSAETNMTTAIGRLNNFTVEIPKVVTAQSEVQFKEMFEKFRTKTLQPNLEIITKGLSEIGKTLEQTKDIFSNTTFVKYLLGQKSAEGLVEEQFGLSLELFLIADDQVYLNSLPMFLQTLQSIMDAKMILKKEWRDGFFSANDKTLLLGNFSHSLNVSIGQLLTVVKRLDGDVSKDGCMQKPALNESGKSLLDVYICLQRMFASPNSLVSEAGKVARHISAIPDHTVDVGRQSKICQAAVCQTFKGTADCTISQSEKLQMTLQLNNLMKRALTECNKTVISAKRSLDESLQTYEKIVLPKYLSALEIGNDVAKQIQKVQETFSKPLWPKTDDLKLLVRNITNYQNVSLNYTDIANVITGYYSIYMEQTFGFNLNKVKTAMADAMTGRNSILSGIAQLKNISQRSLELDANATANGNGIFSLVVNTVLWDNNTDENVQKTVDMLASLQNTTVPLTNEITTAGQSMTSAYKLLADDCKKFLEKTTMNSDFFAKNFMVVNVNIQELSSEVITQTPAADFWNLVADLGGAGSFWLGLSVVSFVEIIDVAIRHGFNCCLLAAMRCCPK